MKLTRLGAVALALGTLAFNVDSFAQFAQLPDMSSGSLLVHLKNKENPRSYVTTAIAKDIIAPWREAVDTGPPCPPWIFPGMLRMFRGGLTPIFLTITSNQVVAYNIFTQAGSPGFAASVTVTVNTGVVCQAGIDTGSGWASGTQISIINNGTFAGGGGAGGAGDSVTSSSAVTGSFSGTAAGHAITLHINVTIDNTNGNVFGGGGGGGGGGMSSTAAPGSFTNANASAGGGGGGGRGYNNASGGAAGLLFGGGSATAGANGSSSGGGAHGQGVITGNLGTRSGDGGDGGDWGSTGGTGADGQHNTSWDAGQNGGLAGNAVKLNGFTVTWTGGNNGTQVKGPQT